MSSAPIRSVLACAIAGSLLAAIGPIVRAAEPADTVLHAARLFDARSGRVAKDAEVLVREGRIVAVAQGGKKVDAAADATRIELGDRTLLPGLIDMHVHIDSDPTYSGYTGLQFNDRFWSAVAVAQAQATLRAGFTTIRNLGADAWNDVGLRQAIDAGKDAGPAHRPAGYSFGATGGHCDIDGPAAFLRGEQPLQRRQPG
jgi:imidazolonepropionase-like amidohydrolase